jgi:hypothetical protein
MAEVLENKQVLRKNPNTFRMKTHSELVVAISKPFTVDSSNEGGCFPIGERWLACSEESQICLRLGKIMASQPIT